MVPLFSGIPGGPELLVILLVVLVLVVPLVLVAVVAVLGVSAFGGSDEPAEAGTEASEDDSEGS